MRKSDVIFLCVNKPENPENGECDLSQIFTLTKSISEMSEKIGNKFFILAIRSTVPVGANKKIKEYMLKINNKLNYLQCSNPEFSRKGSTIYDFLNPDRIVIGIDDEICKEQMSLVYKPLTDKGFEIFFTNIETAEMIKYASNTFLNIKIGFINEISYSLLILHHNPLSSFFSMLTLQRGLLYVFRDLIYVKRLVQMLNILLKLWEWIKEFPHYF